MDALPDIELWSRIRNADAAALELLFTRHYERLCAFATRIVRKPDVAEEVVSDVFVNVWEKRRKLNIQTNVRAYLYTAVRNRCLNQLASRRNAYESIDDQAEQVVDQRHDAAQGMVQKEVVAEVEAMIQSMPPRRQLIFRMSRIDGLKYKEIAQILEISVNTVQNQMVEAVRHIASFYDPDALRSTVRDSG